MKEPDKFWYVLTLTLLLNYIQLQLPFGLRHFAWPLDTLVLAWYIYDTVILHKKKQKVKKL